MTVAAILSIIIMIGAGLWRLQNPANMPIAALDNAAVENEVEDALAEAAEPTAESEVPDSLTDFGNQILANLVVPYAQLQETGTYNAASQDAIVNSALDAMKIELSHKTYSSADVKTTNDTSYDRMMRYRSDLQISLAPMQTIGQPEFEIFAQYVDTKDKAYLIKLSNAAVQYRAATAATAKVLTPIDAVPYQVAILNAMEQFASALDQLVKHADDPFASVAALRSYNQAESDVFTSFNAMTTYYKSKQP